MIHVGDPTNLALRCRLMHKFVIFCVNLCLIGVIQIGSTSTLFNSIRKWKLGIFYMSPVVYMFNWGSSDLGRVQLCCNSPRIWKIGIIFYYFIKSKLKLEGENDKLIN